MAFDVVGNIIFQSNIGDISKEISSKLTGIKATLSIDIDRNVEKELKSISGYLGDIQKKLLDVAATSKVVSNALGDLGSKLQAARAEAKKLAEGQIEIVNVGDQFIDRTKKIIDGLDKATKASARAGTAVSQTNEEVKRSKSVYADFGSQAALAAKRYLAFTVALSAGFTAFGKIKEAAVEAVQFQDELIKISQVSDRTLSQLRPLVRTIGELSTSYGTSSKELTNATLTLAQAGFTAAETEKSLKTLAKISLAPTFNGITNAVEGMIAVMGQFGGTVDDFEQQFSIINAISAKFAVESEDLVSAIRRTGSTFALLKKDGQTATESLTEFLAIITSVRATTRESAESIATGLRTIFPRLQRKDTINNLREMGIELTDLQGKFIGIFPAILKIGNALKDLDAADPRVAKIYEDVGGIRQIGKTIPLFQQTQVALEAINVAKEASNSLDKDAEKRQQSLIISYTKLGERVLAVFREIGDSNTFKSIEGFFRLILDSVVTVIEAIGKLAPLLTVVLGKKLLNVNGPSGDFFGAFRNTLLNGVPRKSSGGFIQGVGNQDSELILGMPGEFIIKKDAAQKLGPTVLRELNQGKIRGYASGGYVHNPGDPIPEYTRPNFIDPNKNKTFVNSSMNFGNGGVLSIFYREMDLITKKLPAIAEAFKKFDLRTRFVDNSEIGTDTAGYYTRVTRTISLPRDRDSDANTVVHELTHALDHFLGRQDEIIGNYAGARSASGLNYATSNPYNILNTLTDLPNVRTMAEERINAYGPNTIVSQSLNGGITAKDYFSSPHEKLAFSLANLTEDDRSSFYEALNKVLEVKDYADKVYQEKKLVQLYKNFDVSFATAKNKDNYITGLNADILRGTRTKQQIIDEHDQFSWVAAGDNSGQKTSINKGVGSLPPGKPPPPPPTKFSSGASDDDPKNNNRSFDLFSRFTGYSSGATSDSQLGSQMSQKDAQRFFGYGSYTPSGTNYKGGYKTRRSSLELFEDLLARGNLPNLGGNVYSNSGDGSGYDIDDSSPGIFGFGIPFGYGPGPQRGKGRPRGRKPRFGYNTTGDSGSGKGRNFSANEKFIRNRTRGVGFRSDVIPNNPNADITKFGPTQNNITGTVPLAEEVTGSVHHTFPLDPSALIGPSPDPIGTYRVLKNQDAEKKKRIYNKKGLPIDPKPQNQRSRVQRQASYYDLGLGPAPIAGSIFDPNFHGPFLPGTGPTNVHNPQGVQPKQSKLAQIFSPLQQSGIGGVKQFGLNLFGATGINQAFQRYVASQNTLNEAINGGEAKGFAATKTGQRIVRANRVINSSGFQYGVPAAALGVGYLTGSSNQKDPRKARIGAVGDVIGGAGIGAVTGAQAGAIFGPLGAPIGAAAGAVVGFTTALIKAQENIRNADIGKALEQLSDDLNPEKTSGKKVNLEKIANKITGVSDVDLQKLRFEPDDDTARWQALNRQTLSNLFNDISFGLFDNTETKRQESKATAEEINKQLKNPKGNFANELRRGGFKNAGEYLSTKEGKKFAKDYENIASPGNENWLKEMFNLINSLTKSDKNIINLNNDLAIISSRFNDFSKSINSVEVALKSVDSVLSSIESYGKSMSAVFSIADTSELISDPSKSTRKQRNSLIKTIGLNQVDSDTLRFSTLAESQANEFATLLKSQGLDNADTAQSTGEKFFEQLKNQFGRNLSPESSEFVRKSIQLVAQDEQLTTKTVEQIANDLKQNLSPVNKAGADLARSQIEAKNKLSGNIFKGNELSISGISQFLNADESRLNRQTLKRDFAGQSFLTGRSGEAAQFRNLSRNSLNGLLEIGGLDAGSGASDIQNRLRDLNNQRSNFGAGTPAKDIVENTTQMQYLIASMNSLENSIDKENVLLQKEIDYLRSKDEEQLGFTERLLGSTGAEGAKLQRGKALAQGIAGGTVDIASLTRRDFELASSVGKSLEKTIPGFRPAFNQQLRRIGGFNNVELKDAEGRLINNLEEKESIQRNKAQAAIEAGQGFNALSVEQFGNLMNEFANKFQNAVAMLQNISIPSSIELAGTINLDISITGAEALAGAKEAFGNLIDAKVNEAVGKLTNKLRQKAPAGPGLNL